MCQPDYGAYNVSKWIIFNILFSFYTFKLSGSWWLAAFLLWLSYSIVEILIQIIRIFVSRIFVRIRFRFRFVVVFALFYHVELFATAVVRFVRDTQIVSLILCQCQQLFSFLYLILGLLNLLHLFILLIGFFQIAIERRARLPYIVFGRSVRRVHGVGITVLLDSCPISVWLVLSLGQFLNYCIDLVIVHCVDGVVQGADLVLLGVLFPNLRLNRLVRHFETR